MRVAVVSNRNRPGFPDDNLRDHLAWIAKAAAAGARLVLFPELSLCGYTTSAFVRDLGLTLTSPPVRAVTSAAREHDLTVAFGMALRQRRRLYISHVLTGPQGLVGHYEKVHLAGPVDGEGRHFTAGEGFRVFDVDGVCVGVQICFDGRHPGSSLALAHLGAEVILHPHGNYVGDLGTDPVSWTGKKRDYLAARAMDTCTYALIGNSVGNVTDSDGVRWRFGGGATVLGPDGRFVARSPSTARRPHMVVADLDIDGLRARRRNSRFAQRREDAYVAALEQPRPPGDVGRPGAA